jgi:hypothetical protein
MGEERRLMGTERADPKAGPTAAAADSNTRSRGEPFVVVPIRYRREHSTWSNAEVAAWLDLLMASYQVGGRFDSPNVARAYLSGRAGALDSLIERGAFVEVGDDWQLADYAELYDESKKLRSYVPNAKRVSEAEAKLERGEPLTEAERKALQRSKRPERDEESEPDKSKRASPDVSGHVPPTNIGDRLGNLYEAFTQLTGLPCEPADKGKIDNLCRSFDRDLVRRAMYSDPEPSRNPEKFIGRTFHRLKEGTVAA